MQPTSESTAELQLSVQALEVPLFPCLSAEQRGKYMEEAKMAIQRTIKNGLGPKSCSRDITSLIFL